jgi:hypothetical protein
MPATKQQSQSHQPGTVHRESRLGADPRSSLNFFDEILRFLQANPGTFPVTFDCLDLVAAFYGINDLKRQVRVRVIFNPSMLQEKIKLGV